MRCDGWTCQARSHEPLLPTRWSARRSIHTRVGDRPSSGFEPVIDHSSRETRLDRLVTRIHPVLSKGYIRDAPVHRMMRASTMKVLVHARINSAGV
jgi:hypothetical protein